MKMIKTALRSAHRLPRILCDCKNASLLLLFLALGTFATAQLRPLNDLGVEEVVPTCKKFTPILKSLNATLNIFGFNQVQLGQTYMYWVQPSDPNNPSNPYTPIWNDEGYLDNKGYVSSSWSDPVNGKEYCTVSFSNLGWCWLTYYRPYNGYMDWGELSIEVIP